MSGAQGRARANVIMTNMKKGSAKPCVFKVSPEISWRQVGDEAVILNTRTSAYYSLNHVALRIWELLSSGTSTENIVADLLREYNITEAVARKDVADLLKSLKEEKIIIAE